jgi:outer membrane protein OmpA-like peptidoglycan-associated protein
VTGDATLGFQPSHAPPLDPAVAQMMGAPPQQRLASVSPARAAAPIPSGSPAAVVTFPENSIGLDANGIAQVQAVVAAYRAKGGGGYVRVVGHSPSGAANLPADRQLMQSFERSQACATSVARELIKDGVPANRVLVDATSTLAAGEQRRAEIFL